MNDFTTGFTLPLKAARLLLEGRGIKRYAVLPIVLNTLIYAACLGIVFYLLFQWEIDVDWEFWGPVGAWLSAATEWSFTTFKWIVGVPLALMVSYFTFTLLGTVLAIPFLDILSERTERLLCSPEDEQKLPLTLTAKQVLLSIYDGLWILAKQIFWTIVVLPLLLIPGVGFIPLFLVSAYFTALGFFDIAMARHYLRNRHKKPALSQSRGQILGLGIAMELLFFIPFCGLFLLPLGAIAGTMMYCALDWEEIFERNDLTAPEGYRAPKLLSSRG